MGSSFPTRERTRGPCNWECLVLAPEPPGSLGFDGRWGGKVWDYTRILSGVLVSTWEIPWGLLPTFLWSDEQVNSWHPSVRTQPPKGTWASPTHSVWATGEAVSGWLQCNQETLPRRFGRKYFPKLRFLVTYPSPKKRLYFCVSSSSEQLGFPICLPG